MTPSPELDRAGDDDLVAATARGDASAFAALFRRHRAAVYRFALHLAGSPAAADDISQEVFLAVMRDASRYDGARATVRAWLFGIARNHARRRADRDRLLLPLLMPVDQGGGETRVAVARAAVVETDPVTEMTRSERVEAVRRAVLSLPFKYREAIVLCDLQELSYAEAAAAMGCAVGTVRSRLHRGHALLAQKLAAIDGHPASWKAHGSGCLA